MNEDLNKKATTHIREYVDVKGQPNLTVGTFCRWVNDDLLPNETLDNVPDFVFSILLLF